MCDRVQFRIRLRELPARMALAVGCWLAPGLSGGPPANEPELPVAAAARRLDALRAEIAHHDALYFQQAEPEISDYAYDQLQRELAELEKAYPHLAAAAGAPPPIGDDRTGLFPVRRHGVRMLSLEKTYSEADLRAFVAATERQLGRAGLAFVVEPKIDGIAISAVYEHGRLVRVVTRGDGWEGDDITANVLTIRSLPRALRPADVDGSPNPVPDFLELRGEAYVTPAEFARVNRERADADEPPFAGPRNLAAGSVRLTDPREAAARRLDVVFYGWGAWEPVAAAPATQQRFHNQVRAWGLPSLGCVPIARGADEVVAAVREFGRRRRAIGAPTDGAVVKLDSVAARETLGASDRAPRWAIAFKFAPERAATQLRAITVQVGRTGLLTPVGELAPVRLAGAIVTRASLHNRQNIARMDLRVGDCVWVERAGEIIPAITGVDRARRPADSRPYRFPMVCPACGAAVTAAPGEAAVRCPNAACPARVRQRLQHFASKDCLALDGLGPAAIEAMVAGGRLRTVADLYRLRREDWIASGAMPGPSADRLIAALERSKHAELWRFVHGLGIPHVGPAAARSLAGHFGSLEALVAAKDDELGAAGAGVGNTTAGAVAAYFREPRNRAVVADLLALGVRPVAVMEPAPAGPVVLP